MISLEIPGAELLLAACSDRKHLNCLIMDPDCDRLSHPERKNRQVCVSRGTITSTNSHCGVYVLPSLK